MNKAVWVIKPKNHGVSRRRRGHLAQSACSFPSVVVAIEQWQPLLEICWPSFRLLLFLSNLFLSLPASSYHSAKKKKKAQRQLGIHSSCV